MLLLVNGTPPPLCPSPAPYYSSLPLAGPLFLLTYYLLLVSAPLCRAFFEEFGQVDASLDVDSLPPAEILGTISDTPCDCVR